MSKAARERGHHGTVACLEAFEDRMLLSLTLSNPIINFSGGALDYSVGLGFGQFDAVADPSTILMPGSLRAQAITVPRSLELHLQLNLDGSLSSEVFVDDLIITGTTTLGGVVVSGKLLTAEVLGFSYVDDPDNPTTDQFDIRLNPTGGELFDRGYYLQDLGINLTSEDSTFSGDFAVAFHGGAKGQIGATPPSQEAPATLGDRVWKDVYANGIQDSDESGVPNIGVELYQEDARSSRPRPM